MESVPAPPQPHFPSPYARPSVAPLVARRYGMTDGAQIATFLYLSETAPHETSRGRESVVPSVPVLMLHGNGEEHGIFGSTIDAVVEAGHAVIAIDSRGQGKSTRGRARLTYELLSNDALSVLDQMEVRRVHILGFSDGGIEALLLARDHPERVASVTALGANLTPEGVIDDPDWNIHELVEQNHAWARYWRQHGEDTSCHAINTGLLTPAPEQADITADLLQLMLDEPHIEATSLAAISCPTTIMVGEFDCVAEQETHAIVDAIPGARLVVVPEAGHTLPKHAPDDVTRELMTTIAGAGRLPSHRK